MDEVFDSADKIFITKQQKLRKMFAQRDSSVLQRMTQPNVINNVSKGRHFAKLCHDIPGHGDQGYTAYYDAIHDR